jgi:cytochrome b6-f complex iron-sulfur subunit
MSAQDASDRDATVITPVLGGCLHTLDRRAFLQRAALGTVAALLAGGFAPSAALAEHVEALTPLRSAGGARTYDIPGHDGVFVDAGSELALARSGGRLFAFSLACPHRGATLQWKEGEQRFFCPKHKARFTADGAHASGRATADLDRFALHRAGGQVVVELDQPLGERSEPAAWAAAVLVL